MIAEASSRSHFQMRSDGLDLHSESRASRIDPRGRLIKLLWSQPPHIGLRLSHPSKVNGPLVTFLRRHARQE